MNRFLKIISSLISLVILYSIVFQSVHVVLHHQHQVSYSHHCQHHNVCLHESNQFKIQTAQKKCAVCDFEFAHFHISQIFHLTPFVNIKYQVVKWKTIECKVVYYIPCIQLRGPPFSILS